MATYPIKVLLDRNRQPFIPFSTTSSIVENGTNRRLDKMLGNLDDLQTNNKNSLVSAINEILTQHGSGGSSTGWQVVDKLPTENISATTIYLVHKEGSKKPNIYEEWIWVNEDWENIGTTEIDLSGYATTSMVGDLNNLLTIDKDNLVDAINEIVGTAGGISANIGNLNNLITEDKSSVVNAINEVASSRNNLPIYDLEVKLDASLSAPSLDSEDRLKCENIINDAYAKGYKNCAILLRSSTKNNSYLKAISLTFSTMDTSSQLTQYQFGGMYNTDDSSIHTNLYFNIYGTWSNNVFTCTNSFVRYENSKKYLSTNNTTNYTPTSDYHPATKKYVDDTVAAAGAGGGSAFDPAKYLAIDNTTEYTPTDLYHPATKAYVDSQIASVPEPVDAYSKTEIDGKLSNYLSKTNTESYTPTSDYHPATKKFVESVVASIDTSGFITNSNISEHLTNYITETTLNERLMKVPYIMTSSVTITSDFDSSGHWGDHTLMCNVNNTDWSAAIQKIAHAILSKEYPKVYMPVTIMLDPDDFNKANAIYRAHHLIELKPSNLGYIAEKTSPHTYSEGDLTDTYITGTVDLGVYGTLYIMFGITYKYSNNSWSYYSTSNTPTASIYIGRVTPVTSLNLTFDNKQIIHSYTEGDKHKRMFSSNVAGCKNLPINATTKIADIAGTSRLPDTLSTRCELFGTTVSGDTTTYTPLGEATVFVYNNEMYMKVPDITTTDYTDVVCTISMIYED